MYGIKNPILKPSPIVRTYNDCLIFLLAVGFPLAYPL